MQDFSKNRIKVSVPGLNSKNRRPNGISLFWVIVAVLSAGLTLFSWNADNFLSSQLSSINLSISAQEVQPSSVRTLNFETRHKTGEGVLDETNTVITGFKVEAFNLAGRMPSFYRLKSQSKVSKSCQVGILKLPNSQLALNQILRI